MINKLEAKRQVESREEVGKNPTSAFSVKGKKGKGQVQIADVNRAFW